MKIETKFSLGDLVFGIRQTQKQLQEPCPTCDGAGRVALVKGGTALCPNAFTGSPRCYEGKITVGHSDPWAIVNASTVGQVRVQVTDPEYTHAGLPVYEYTYMLEATGVVSGTLWDESLLYATEDSALVECARRNALVPEAVHGR